MAIFRGTGGTGDSTTDTTVNTVTQKAAEAAASATAAASSATQAANSAASINANIVNDTTPQLGGELDGQTNKITNIGDPTSAQDAATKTYVDSQVQSKDALSELSGDSDDITEGSTNLFLTTTERTKLSGIEASATADQTAAEIRTLVESASDSNVFTNADHSKLDGIEASATADQTDAEIKTAYENNSDTNAFTDAEKTKLSGIETGATADQTASEILTAIKTVDGSGSGLDADLLDGNEASAFATSAQGSTADSALQNVSEDTTPQLGGDLDLNSNDITGTGNINITGTLQTSSNAIIGGDLTVSGTTTTVNTETINLADNNIVLNSNHTGTPTQNAGITIERGTSTDKVFQWNESSDYWETDDNFNVTGNITVSGTVDGRDVAADGTTLDAVASTYVNVSGDTLTGDLAFGDNVKAKFGASDDLQIYHNGSASFIDEGGTGDLNIRANNLGLRNISGAYYVYCVSGGSVSLRHNNVNKLATTSSGVDVTGTVVADKFEVTSTSFLESTNLQLSAGFPRLILLENDTTNLNSRISHQNGALRIETLNDAGTTGTKRLDIDHSTGDISFYEDTGTTAKLTWDASDESLNFSDSVRLKLGSSADFQGFHNGSNSYWENYTGDLYIDNRADDKDVNIRTDNGSGGYTFYFKADGSTGDAILYHYGTEKIKTQSGGVDVTGTVTADGFLGGTNVLRINSLEGTRGSIQISAPHLGTREVTYGNNFYLASDGTYKQDSAVIGGGLLQITAPNAEFGEFLFKSKQDPDSGGAVRDRIKIANSGDISFYDDAGTSQDFYWDASTSRLGIKTTSPSYDFHVKGDANATAATSIQASDRTTDGQSSASLRLETVARTGGANRHTRYEFLASPFSNFGNANLTLKYRNDGTDGPDVLNVTRDGDIEFFAQDGTTADFYWDKSTSRLGIGTTSPAADLHVSNTSGSELRIDTVGGANADSVLNFRENGVDRAKLYWDGADNDLYLETTIGDIGLMPAGNVGIGTTSPEEPLTVQSGLYTGTIRIGADANAGTLTNATQKIARINAPHYTNAEEDMFVLGTSTSSNQNVLYLGGGSGNHNAATAILFYTASNHTTTTGSEAARIDSSGNLLVGKTALDTSSDGVELRSSGFSSFTKNNDTAIYVTRRTSDGEIVRFRKDGTTIGSIGVLAGHLGIAEGGCGLRFENDTQRILPANSTYGTNDASIDLGRTDGRFKDLYLSNGVRADTLKFSSLSGTEYGRFDSSGNLLVGTTDTTVGSSSTVDGIALLIDGSGGIITAARSGTVARLNRQSSDGEIINLRKNGTTIGSIGNAFSDNLYISGDSNHAGVAFGTNVIYPSTTTGAAADNEFDLGNSTSRFKDLYLSGGVYLGGTGSANLLDDYEEGTFTPTFGGSTADPSGVTYDSQIGTYTKVGTSVQVTIKLGTDAITSVGSGNLRIRGLPFNPNYGLGAGRLTAYSFASNIEDYNILIGNGYFDLLKGSPFGYAQTSVLGTGTNANRLWVTFSYETT